MDAERAELHLSAESTVLGLILMRGNSAFRTAAGPLSASSWGILSHKAVWEAMHRVDAAGAPVDLVTVSDDLRTHGHEDILECSFVSGLMDGIPRLTNFEHYLKVVRDDAIRREIQKHSQMLGARAAEDDLSGVLAWAQKAAGEFTGRLADGRARSFDTTLGEALDEIERRQKAGGVPGLATGFPVLDDMTGGMEPMDLIVLAGRTSSGKTSLALDIIRHVAMKLSKRVLVYSLEMSAGQLATRLACQDAHINLSNMRRGALTDSDWSAISLSYARLHTLDITIDDTAALTIGTIISRTKGHQHKGRVGLIVVDYLGLVRPDSQRENRAQDVAAISGALKRLAKDNACPVLALHQLNRAPEGGASAKRRLPRLADLKDSSSIEQDADHVWLLYREEQGQEATKKERDGKTILIVAKQRNGPTGVVPLEFVERLTSFRTPAGRQQEEHDDAPNF